MDITSLGSTDTWPIAAGFDQVTTREEVKSEVYSLNFAPVFSSDNSDGTKSGLIGLQTKIMLWKPPYNGTSIKLFVHHTEGDVTIGKVMQIKTPLNAGEFDLGDGKRTPYYVDFTLSDGTNVEVYDPNTMNTTFRELLGGLDIISKKDLPSALPKLWSEK